MAFFFLHNYMGTIKKYALSHSSGSTFLEISGKGLAKAPINLPSIAEQKKIGSLLNCLEIIITLEQEKLEKLKKVKEYLLQQMFANESGYPKLRFKGFEGKWIQRMLGNLGSLKNGMNFSKEAMGRGSNFVNLSNIFDTNVVSINDLDKALATEKQLEEYNLLKGDVLFVRSSVKLEGVGHTALVSKDLHNTTYSGFIIRFRDKVGLDDDFKKYIFSTHSVRTQVLSKATNSANKNINQVILEKLVLHMPNKEEQSKIGNFLDILEKIIDLEQHKLDHLLNVKQKLLQSLFV